jgi:hypothetical protein
MKEKLYKILRLFGVFTLLLGLLEKLYNALSKKLVLLKQKIDSLKQRLRRKRACDPSATNFSTIA